MKVTSKSYDRSFPNFIIKALELSRFISASLDCKTVGFFLKITKEIDKAWRKSLTREYLNTQKYGTVLQSTPSLK